MAFAFAGTDHAYVSAASSVSLTPPSTTGLFYCAVYAFSGVAAGSGPWIKPWTTGDPNNVIGNHTGWQQALFQAPSGTGVGIEIWCAINGGSGPRIANFVSASTCQAVISAYSGAFAPTGSIFDGAVRTSAKAQVTGNSPPSPAVTAVAGDLVIPCAADLMQTPGMGTPAGYTVRIDGHDNGFGSAEAAIGDAVAASSGSTGAITWTGTAATVGTLGTTATLAVKPLIVPTTTTGIFLDFTFNTS